MSVPGHPPVLSGLVAICCVCALGILVASSDHQIRAEEPKVLLEKTAESGATISGELKQWHKVTLTLDGPQAGETDRDANPFLDFRLTVRFTHESGQPDYRVPGYFAADGRAAESSATAGNKWRAHLSPDKPGKWTYRASFVRGKNVAVELDQAGKAVDGIDGTTGCFQVAATDKTGHDLRGKGRLEYVGQHYLRFAGSGEYFLKAGPDAPETLLAYRDFDGTETKKSPLKSWKPHVRDWRQGDPTWKDGRGKGLIGALNYLGSKGCNAFSFLTYNVGGDGQNVWPMVAPDDPLHYDCSKLDQWQIVFDHAQSQGLYLHFKMQEQENDDNRQGDGKGGNRRVAAALDGGDLGPARKLYCRELVSRFGYELALNWNLGEENTQSAEQQRAMAGYLNDLDPYDHNIVVHTFPGSQDSVYSKLLGKQSVLTGASLQNGWSQAHRRTLKWVQESAKVGRPWVVANDEQGPANMGVPPDPGYQGHDGQATEGRRKYDLHDIRRNTLWGTLMAGGAGVEYYFGYELPQNDLTGEDFRSRDRTWDFCRIALDFFHLEKIPFPAMANHNILVGNRNNDNTRYCFAKPRELYLVYQCEPGESELDLTDTKGSFSVRWYDPRSGGELQKGSVEQVTGGRQVKLGRPPKDADDDWLVVVRR